MGMGETFLFLVIYGYLVNFSVKLFLTVTDVKGVVRGDKNPSVHSLSLSSLIRAEIFIFICIGLHDSEFSPQKSFFFFFSS